LTATKASGVGLLLFFFYFFFFLLLLGPRGMTGDQSKAVILKIKNANSIGRGTAAKNPE